MWTIGAIVVGVVIGWHLPQPQWAKNAQAWITAKVKGWTGL